MLERVIKVTGKLRYNRGRDIIWWNDNYEKAITRLKRAYRKGNAEKQTLAKV